MLKYSKSKRIYGRWLYLLVLLCATSKNTAAIYRPIQRVVSSCKQLAAKWTTCEASLPTKDYRALTTLPSRHRQRYRQSNFEEEIPYYTHSFLPFVACLVGLNAWLVDHQAAKQYKGLYEKAEAEFNRYNTKYPNSTIACSKSLLKRWKTSHVTTEEQDAKTQIEDYRAYVEAVTYYRQKQAEKEEATGVPIPESYQVKLHNIAASIKCEELRNYQSAVFNALANPKDWKTVEDVYNMLPFIEINQDGDFLKSKVDGGGLNISWTLECCKFLLETICIHNPSFWKEMRKSLLRESRYLCAHSNAYQRKAQLFACTLALDHASRYTYYNAPSSQEEEEVKQQIAKNRRVLKRYYNSPITEPLNSSERTLHFLGKASETILNDMGIGALLYGLSLNPVVGAVSFGTFVLYQYFSTMSTAFCSDDEGELFRIEKDNKGYSNRQKRFVDQVLREVEAKRHSPKVAKGMLDFIYGLGNTHCYCDDFDDCDIPLAHDGYYGAGKKYYPEQWAAYYKMKRSQKIIEQRLQRCTEQWIRIFDQRSYDTASVEKAGTVAGIMASFVLTPLMINALDQGVQGLLNTYWNTGAALTEEVAIELQEALKLTSQGAREAHIEQICKNYPKHARKIRQIWEESHILSATLLPKNVDGLGKLSQGNFRRNLARYQGLSVAPAGKDAHHIFPVCLEKEFREAGLNIHDPTYGLWWGKHAHRRNAAKYNREWRKFFDRCEKLGEVPTHAAIFDEALTILKKCDFKAPLLHLWT